MDTITPRMRDAFLETCLRVWTTASRFWPASARVKFSSGHHVELDTTSQNHSCPEEDVYSEVLPRATDPGSDEFPELTNEEIKELCKPVEGWDIAGAGCTARVERLGTDQVVKLQYAKCQDYDMTRKELQREFDIYQRIPPHPRLLPLLPGSQPHRLILPYLANGTLLDRLKPDAPALDPKQRLQLAADAAEAVTVLHANAVVHCDLKPNNFMVDDEDRLRVIDFSGSMLDGQEGTVAESTRYFLPRPIEEPCTVRTDLFALGSVVYAILTGRAPYEDKTDEEVEKLFSNNIFPATDGLVGGEVSTHCWTGVFVSAKEPYQALSFHLYNASKG